ncbi:MAG: hypothetical protein IKM21_02335 [Oscillospiraceae bacterium]|nr:hypothetical protein [Oscillospiraceae bacterium]
MNFEGFYGNERAKNYITSSFARNAFPHALLIVGDRGIGKKTLAAIIAKALVCSEENPPCGTCDSCLKAERGIHPDIQVLGTDSSSVGVARIRELKRDALLRPNDAEKKVYIINDAGSMTHEAQDAFLKILEEPPSFTFFILLCGSYSDLLPTIVSRTAHLSLSPLNEDDMMKVIRKKLPEISEAEAKELAASSDGVCSFLAEVPNAESLENTQSIIEAILSSDDFELYKAFSCLEKAGRDMLLATLDELIVVFRDSLVLSSRAESRTLSSLPGTFSERLSKLLSPSKSAMLIEHILAAKEACQRNIGVAHLVGELICKFAQTIA